MWAWLGQWVSPSSPVSPNPSEVSTLVLPVDLQAETLVLNQVNPAAVTPTRLDETLELEPFDTSTFGDGPSATPDVGWGEVPSLDGIRFEIHERVGSGNMGSVYRATMNTEAGPQTVAIKVLQDQWKRGEVFDTARVQELQREASVGLRVSDHESFAKVHGLTTLDGRLAFVMEHIDGVDLEALTKRSKGLSDVELTAILKDAGSGLARLHQEGFVHGDIKPANLMVNKAGQIKIVDLGIVVPVDPVKCHEQYKGTLPYASPEAIQYVLGHPQNDTLALAKSVFFCATGGERLHPPNRALLGSLLQGATEWNANIQARFDKDGERWAFSGLRASLEGAMQHSAEARPSVAELAKHAVTRQQEWGVQSPEAELAQRVASFPVQQSPGPLTGQRWIGGSDQPLPPEPKAPVGLASERVARLAHNDRLGAVWLALKAAEPLLPEGPSTQREALTKALAFTVGGLPARKDQDALRALAKGLPRSTPHVPRPVEDAIAAAAEAAAGRNPAARVRSAIDAVVRAKANHADPKIGSWEVQPDKAYAHVFTFRKAWQKAWVSHNGQMHRDVDTHNARAQKIVTDARVQRDLVVRGVPPPPANAVRIGDAVAFAHSAGVPWDPAAPSAPASPSVPNVGMDRC